MFKKFLKISFVCIIILLVFISGFSFFIYKNNPFDFQRIFTQVIQQYPASVSAIPVFLNNKDNFDKPTEFLVNSNRVLFETGQSYKSINHLLDLYQKEYNSDSDLKEWIAKITSSNGNNFLFDFFVDSIKPSMRAEANNKGMLISFKPTFTKDDNIDNLLDKINDFIDTGLISSLFEPKVVFAETLQNGNSMFMNISFDKDFRLNNFLVNPGQDAPGNDITDIPKYPESTRILSIEELSSSNKYHMNIYTSQANQDSIYNFYIKKMEKMGWIQSLSFKEAINKLEANQKALFFHKINGSECQIILENSELEESITIISWI